MKIRISRVTIASLVLGSGLIIVGNYLYSAYLAPSQSLVLPDLLKKLHKPPDWGAYSNFNQALSDFKVDRNTTGFPRVEAENRASAVPDTLKDQIERIRAIFDEEVRFRRESLNNTLLAYQTRLNREMNQELEEETNSLSVLTTKKIAAKEKELKASFEKYRSELRAEYQKRLVDLNLQVLISANPPNDFSKTEGLSEAQAEINRIHEEFISKLNARQQQSTEQLTEYSKQLQEANKISLTQLRVRLSESIRSEISNFQTVQEDSYRGWYQKRSREISTAIELRAKDSL